MKNFFVLLLVLSFGKFAVAGVDISGEYRYRESNNYSGAESGRTTDPRFILGASFREGDSLMAHFSLISNGDEAVRHESYAMWNFADAFEFKFGTFAMDWANGSVFSANTWENTPTTFDGLSLAYDAGMVKVSLAEIADNFGAENKIQAVAVDFMSLPEFAKTVHAFYVKEGDLSKVGAVVAGNVAMLNYELTYIADSNGDVKANMQQVKANVDTGMGSVVLTYHKDEDGFNRFKSEKHANAGLMDLNDWGDAGGLTYYTAGYVYSLNDSTALGALYHSFSQTDNGDKKGTEIDVYASRKYNDVLAVTARYGKYTPEGGEDHSAWMIGLNLNF